MFGKQGNKLVGEKRTVYGKISKQNILKMFHYAEPEDLGKLQRLSKSLLVVKNKESFCYHTPTTVIQHLNKLTRVKPYGSKRVARFVLTWEIMIIGWSVLAFCGPNCTMCSFRLNDEQFLLVLVMGTWKASLRNQQDHPPASHGYNNNNVIFPSHILRNCELSIKMNTSSGKIG